MGAVGSEPKDPLGAWTAPVLRLAVGALPEPALGGIERQAVRGVVVREAALLMIRSSAGDVKFPGGGVAAGETLADALAREVREECGRRLTGIDSLVLVVDERRAAQTPGWVLRMQSVYLACEVGPVEHALALDDYERDLGFHPEWVTATAAIAANRAALAAGTAAPWVTRELRVLEALFPAPPREVTGGRD
jgi:ADP-ribose pyrophosphatase YjhB (NUDIX family)